MVVGGQEGLKGGPHLVVVHVPGIPLGFGDHRERLTALEHQQCLMGQRAVLLPEHRDDAGEASAHAALRCGRIAAQTWSCLSRSGHRRRPAGVEAWCSCDDLGESLLGFGQAQLAGDQAREQGVAQGGEGLGLL